MGSTCLDTHRKPTLRGQALPDGLEAGGEMMNPHDLLTYRQSNGIILFLLSVVV